MQLPDLELEEQFIVAPDVPKDVRDALFLIYPHFQVRECAHLRPGEIYGMGAGPALIARHVSDSMKKAGI